MTDLQKKIRKSSRFTSMLFGYLCIFPFWGLLLACTNLWGLLRNDDRLLFTFARESPKVSRGELFLYTLLMISIYLLATWGMLMARSIFRQISEEYSPFNPMHVKKMRRIALFSLICILGKALLEGWAMVMQGGRFSPDINLAWFLLPIVVYSFSFILDYACQLQAEADTTL